MITKEIIEENKEYLDRVAVAAMVTYLERTPLKGFSDSMSVARICYKQALAMLEVRETTLISLAEDALILRKKKGA
jgi:hypothetical protein